MIIGIDSSAVSASCALTEGNKIIAEQFLNTRHTHSETLLPMVKSMLDHSGFTLSDTDAVAITHGPGSFTGLRIGISCVKGMCVGAEKPCIAVSTLEAIAYNFLGVDGVICACMDARRKQVYNALFRSENGVIKRLCEDRAIAADALSAELATFSEKIIFAGDGAELMDSFTNHRYTLSPPALRFQRGSGVCFAAEGLPKINPAALMPSYLRLSQAERERMASE